jgi:glyoxylate reductase
MPRSVFVTQRIPEAGLRILRDKGYDVVVNDSDAPLGEKKLIAALEKRPYGAVLSLLTDRIDARAFDAAPTVKLYANYASGFDNIDIAEAKRRGIMVSNAPTELSSEAVAQFTVSLIFALATRLVEADSFVRRGRYEGWRPMNFIGMSIPGKTLGLIGAGRIGASVARHCVCLGMNVIYTDVVRNEALEKEHGAVYLSSAEEVLKRADVVSLHVPLLDTTRHLMNEERLRLMKPTALLVNTSRGPVIDERALVNALERGTIAGAALDVYEYEPQLSPGLSKLPNVILTPHIASATGEARDAMATIAAQNIVDFFEGNTPRTLVNP